MSNYQRSPFDLRRKMTPMVRRLMQGLVAVYVLQIMLAQFAPELAGQVTDYLALRYENVFGDFFLWQVVTYAILHDVGVATPLFDLILCVIVVFGIIRGAQSPSTQREPMLFLILAFAAITIVSRLGHGAPFHLGGNLLFFYFFGPMFEKKWGPRRFLLFCGLTAVGGALVGTLAYFLLPMGWNGGAALGASGATMGLLMAFAVYNKDGVINYGFVLPMKARHLLVIVVIFDVIGYVTDSTVAFWVHMGGLYSGWLLTTGSWRPSRWLRRFGVGTGSPRRKSAPHLRLVRDDDDEPPLLH